MANHAGNEGTVKVGSDAIAEIRSYTIEETSDTTEDTAMGDTWRTHKTTLLSWTASVDCWWDETDTTGQGALTVGSEVTLNLYPEGDASSATYYSGTGIVTGVNRSASLDGMVEASISVQGTGALTESTVV